MLYTQASTSGSPPYLHITITFRINKPVISKVGLRSVVVVELLSHVKLFAIPWTATCQASLSISNSQSLLKFMSIESVMPPTHLVPFSTCLQSFPASGTLSLSRLCIRWPKYWSFSFSISPSNVYSGLISFKIDWLYLLAVQGTLKSLLQPHSPKASILQCSTFLIVQLYILT